MKTLMSLIAFFSLSIAFAGDEHMTPAKVSPEFESMKALIGTWEGKTKMHGKEEMTTVTYELTSGGTAIVERMNPGTPGEMTTVYANSGKKVNATHYCAMGNQPQMTLKQAKGTTFAFEMVGTNGISDKNETHMHAVTLTVNGNKLKQEWTSFQNGKKGESPVFELTKKM
jgi:hypothetical protein